MISGLATPWVPHDVGAEWGRGPRLEGHRQRLVLRAAEVGGGGVVGGTAGEPEWGRTSEWG